MAGENPASTTEYIQHHLTNLVYGKLPAGYERHTDQGVEVLQSDTWTMAHGGQEAADMGFWAIHVDSMAWSIGLGSLFCWMFMRAAKKAHTGVPAGWLNFVEMVVEFIDGAVKDSFHGRNKIGRPVGADYFRLDISDELNGSAAGRSDSVAVGIDRYPLSKNCPVN